MVREDLNPEDQPEQRRAGGSRPGAGASRGGAKGEQRDEIVFTAGATRRGGLSAKCNMEPGASLYICISLTLFLFKFYF